MTIRLDKKTKNVMDYLEFIKYFGSNEELYEKLKPLRINSSWKELRNIKLNDISFENGTINIETE